MDTMFKKIKEMAEQNMGTAVQFLRREKNKEYKDYILSHLSNEVLKMNFGESEMLYYFLNNVSELQKCMCGEMKKYWGPFLGYKATCGKKECYVQSRKNACLEKYGVENPMQSKEVQLKSQETIHKKYNGKHYLYDPKIKEKMKKTNIEKYGVENPMQSDKVKNKVKQTWENKDINEKKEIIEKRIEKFKKTYEENKEDITQKKKNTIIEKYGSLEKYYEHFNKKFKETSLLKYGFEHHFKNKNIQEKRILSYSKENTDKIKENLEKNNLFLIERDYVSANFNIMAHCNVCNNDIKIKFGLFKDRLKKNELICSICNPTLHSTSKQEKEIIEYVQSIDKGIIKNSKNYIHPYELDIMIPNLKIAIEYNGLFWHSELYKDENDHVKKTELCEEKGLHLIHIYEDDWLFKQEIVKSRINNLLHINQIKISARKCVVKNVNDKEIRKFLDENHIQGYVSSKINYGLYHNNELVSLMTFGHLRGSTGNKSKEGHYEMYRFCNKLNHTVSGGASKLFSHFLKEIKPFSVLSYADRSWSKGNLYQRLGFNFIKNTKPNYYWIIDGQRKNRYNYNKSQLIKKGQDANKTVFEIMSDLGYYKIWDSGSQVWLYENNI